MRARVVLAYLACCVLWGSTWMAIKIGLQDLPPLRFAASRMAIASALLLPFALRAGMRQLEARRWKVLALVGALNLGFPFALLFAAQRWVPSGLAAVFFATFPMWLVLLGRMFLPDQPLTPPRLLAGVLGLGGIAVIQLPQLRNLSVDASVAVGGLFVILAAILIALANVVIKRSLGEMPAAVAAWGQTGTGALILGALAFALEPGQVAVWTPRAVAALLYLAVFGTVVTYVTMFWLISRLSMAAVGAIPLLDTLVAVTLGALFLHEQPGWQFGVGTVLILLAAALANLAPPARPREAPRELVPSQAPEALPEVAAPPMLDAG